MSRDKLKHQVNQQFLSRTKFTLSEDISFMLHWRLCYLAVPKDISKYCTNQSDFIMTASLDGKDHLFADYYI